MRSRPRVTFVIMAGGRGERLWPLVRAWRPKVCLAPDGRRTLLEMTIRRLRPVAPSAATRWMIVTTRPQAEAVRRATPPALRRSVVVEPQGRNTAACLTLAAVRVAAREPQRIMVVIPADHWIGDTGAFQRSVRSAIRASASRETIATIGIRPTHAHPGLGYLLAGRQLPGGPRVYQLKRFIEKPSARRAMQLAKSGRTYWNSGIFVGSAETFLRCVTEHLPNHARRLIALANGASPAGRRRAERAYRTLEPISFDHGVMEHLREGVIVEGRFPWADLGSWEIWAGLQGRQAADAKAMTVDGRNVLVVSQEPHLVATIGLRDLIVVHTPTATLICPRDRTQAVRDVVKRLHTQRALTRYV